MNTCTIIISLNFLFIYQTNIKQPLVTYVLHLFGYKAEL